MKRALSRTIFTKIAYFLTGISFLSLTGCLDKDNDTPQPQPRAFVSFYHGSPDAPDVDILVNTQRLNSNPFKYSHYSNYVAFNPGTFRVKFAPLNAAGVLTDSSLTFQQDKAYSVFLIDKLADADMLVLTDSLDAPATGKARLRFVNLSPDAPEVSIATTGTSSASLFTQIGFKGNTEFMDQTAGTHTLQVKNAASGEVLLSVPSVDVVAGNIYTLVLRGFVTPPAGNTNTLTLQLLKAGS